MWSWNRFSAELPPLFPFWKETIPRLQYQHSRIPYIINYTCILLFIAERARERVGGGGYWEEEGNANSLYSRGRYRYPLTTVIIILQIYSRFLSIICRGNQVGERPGVGFQQGSSRDLPRRSLGHGLWRRLRHDRRHGRVSTVGFPGGVSGGGWCVLRGRFGADTSR